MSTNQTEDAISQGIRPQMNEVRTYKYYAGGEWRPATSGKTFDVHQPYGGQLYAKVAAGGAADARIAVQAAAIKAMRKAATAHSVLGSQPALPAAIAVLPVPGYASMTLLLRFHDTRLNSRSAPKRALHNDRSFRGSVEPRARNP